jgi:hypothetical protein
VIVYRHCDRRFPFLWEGAGQLGARWHADGEGPVQYFADTPDGAWAELLRHEEITDPADLAGVRRAIWAVDIGDEPLATPSLPARVLRGGVATYARAAGLIALSAALRPGAARGWRVDGGVRPGTPIDGRVIVLFGPRPDAVGWCVVDAGRPPADVLPKVHHLTPSG